MENYLIHILIMINIYGILAISLNLLLGYTGILNLGHVAFFGIGAYTSSILTKVEVPFVLAFIVAGIMSGVFGSILMMVSNKLKGDFFALASLSFNFLFYSIMNSWTSLTGGPLGIMGITKPYIGGLQISSSIAYMIFSLVIFGLVIFVTYRITKSPYGKSLEAMRDDEIRLKLLGKNTFKLKFECMIMSAFFAGIAGSLYAHYITFIDPSTFTLKEVVILLTIVILGGLTSLRGTVIATVIIMIIPEFLRFIYIPPEIVGPLRQIMYSLVLIVILIYKPRGLFNSIVLE